MSLEKFLMKSGAREPARIAGLSGKGKAALAAALGLGGGAAAYGAMGGEPELEDIDDLESAGEYGKAKLNKLIEALGLG